MLSQAESVPTWNYIPFPSCNTIIGLLNLGIISRAPSAALEHVGPARQS
jgi:hypothetical protein